MLLQKNVGELRSYMLPAAAVATSREGFPSN
jgi:hypothetical protein